MKALFTIILLVLSNIFMTFAWYGHLKLQEMKIPIVAEDTGGNYGRTVQIDLSTGVYKVKTIDKADKEF